MYGLRMKNTVAEGIVARDYSEANLTTSVVYEPGNGTRYEITVTMLTKEGCDVIGCSEYSYLVAWLNDINKCMLLARDGFIHYSYVMEKMHIRSLVDAVVLTELLGYLVGRPGTTCEDMQEEVGYIRTGAIVE